MAQTKPKVGILGAGNAGYTFAYHLASQGYPVMLFEHPDFKQAVEPINNSNGEIVALETYNDYKAAIHGKVKIEAATTDMKKVIEFADVVIMIVPAFGQVPIFELAMPHIHDGQIFVIMPGNFACLAFLKLMKEKGVKKNLIFAESETIPYACRRIKDNEIFISGIKVNMTMSVFPGNKTDETIALLTPIIHAKLLVGPNVLLAGFANTNMVAHPPPSLFNAGWIESGRPFPFYQEGCSPSVCRYIDRIDAERMEIAKACGLTLKNCSETLSWWYGLNYKTTHEAFSNSPYHAALPGPANMENRYITEDVAFLLAPLAKYLGPKFGIKTPAMDAVVTVAETFLGRKVEPMREFSAILKENETPEQMQQRLFTGNVE